MILPLTEKQFELRELACRKHNVLLDELKENCESTGITMSKDNTLLMFKITCNEYEALVKRLWDGDTTEEEIEKLKALEPTNHYKPTGYIGELTGGTDSDLDEEEYEENGIFLVDSENGRRIRHSESKHCYEYIDISTTSYDDIANMLLKDKDQDSELYGLVTQMIESFKSKNTSPDEVLSILQEALDKKVK